MDVADRVLAAIAEAKGDDPLAPVEVVCAIGARRLRLEIGRRASLANVRVHASKPRSDDDAHLIAVGPLRRDVEAAVGQRCAVSRIAVETGIDVREVRVVSCTDATVEARVVIDALRRARLAGCAWSSMAVAVAVGDEEKIADACRRASIPVSIGRSRPLLQSCAGRFAVGLLDVIAAGFSRAAMSSWWATVPLIDPATGSPVPVARWEHASRTGGVVSGDDWSRSREPALVAFIEMVRAQSTNVDGLAAAILASIGRLLPAVDSAEWEEIFGERSDIEGEAVDSVRAVLTAISGSSAHDKITADNNTDAGNTDAGNTAADNTAADNTADEVRNALVASLSARRMVAHGRIGEGVQIDRPEHLATGTFRFVVVTGMIEAALPRADDLRSVRLAALAQLLRAGHVQRIVSIPRVDPRGEREAYPSPVILASLAEIVGSAIDGATVHDDPAVHGLPIERVDSFEAALLGTNGFFPLDESDVLIRALCTHASAGGDLPTHPSVHDTRLADTLNADRARRSAAWTTFDGRLGTAPDPFARPWSVTAIESFHTCPLRVFLHQTLHAPPLQRPEEGADPNSRATGTVVHAFLDALAKRWLRERSEPERLSWAPWLRAADRATIESVWSGTVDAQRQDGVIHHGVLWDAQLRWIKARLDGFVNAEANDDQGFDPIASETGAARTSPWRVDTPIGPLQVTGRADRIDSDGATLRVIDFKTGNLPARSLSADPLDGGKRLQLPLYAAMHESVAAQSYARTEGRYVNPLRASAKDRSVALDLTDVISDAVGLVADFAVSYGQGDFRYRTGASGAHCTFCDAKASCPVDRTRSERRKRAHDAARSGVDE